MFLAGVLLILYNCALSYAGIVQLPKTGQTACYGSNYTVIPCSGTGQDGAFQEGVAWPNPRFTDNNNGTITDNLTGLIWLRDPGCSDIVAGINPLNAMTLADALTWSNGLSNGKCGLSDGSSVGQWRLPNISEYESLVDISRPTYFALPSPNPFVVVADLMYISSTTYAGNTGIGWTFYIGDGSTGTPDSVEGGFSGRGRGWAVRSGPYGGTIQLPKTGQKISYGTNDDGALQEGVAWPNPRFTDNGNGTVTDKLTGLIWLRNAACTATVAGIYNPLGELTWQNALIWTNGLANGICGLTDGSSAGQWRLPNRNELQSLIDRSQYNPALPSGHPFEGVFLGKSYVAYWTSSTYLDDANEAWEVYMYDGSVDPIFTNAGDGVWPVRSGTANITVDSTGAGSGAISSNTGGLSYTYPTANTVAAYLNYGTSVTLTATAGRDTTVTWSGCDSTGGTSTVTTCSINSISAARTVTATFTFTAVWTQIPGAIISPPAIAWNPSLSRTQMVVRGSNNSIWSATFSSAGVFNNDWTQIPGAMLSPPAIAWNPVSSKMQMIVQGSGNSIWSSTFNSSGAFDNDWTQIPGAILSPPAIVWNPVSSKMQMIVQGSGNSIWSSTFNSSGAFNNDWTQIPGAILSPPAIVWNSNSSNTQMVVQGSNNTIWSSTFNSSGGFNSNWTQIPGAIISPPALAWNPSSNTIQMLVRGSGNTVWAATFSSAGVFDSDWSEIPGAVIDPPAIVWNPVAGNFLIVSRGTNDTIWSMIY